MGYPFDYDIMWVPSSLWQWVPSWLWDYGRSNTVSWMGYPTDDIMMKVTSWLTMTLLGTLMTMRLWEIHKTMRFNGVPCWLWYYRGSLLTMTLWGYPHDLRLWEIHQDNEVNGVPFWPWPYGVRIVMTMTLWGYPHYNDIKGGTVMTMILWGYSHDYKTLWSALPSWLWHYGGPQEKDINGVPFWLWYYVGSLITMKYIAYPHDYEIMGDP